MAESALIVRVPEAERLVGPFRKKFDPVAALGMPAHITLLYPFIPPGQISDADLGEIGSIAAAKRAFRFRLSEARQFHDTLYLAPDPEQPFVQLTTDVVSRFPKYQPYEGKFSSIIPHLTVAHGDEQQLRALHDEIAADPRLMAGINAMCDALVLIDNSSGLWRARQVFRLTSSSE